MTDKMMKAMEKIGKRWQKGDMDRFYINITAADELYRSIPDDQKQHGALACNRRERELGKVWIDVKSDAIEMKGFRSYDEMHECITDLIAYLEPTEAVEAPETVTMYHGSPVNGIQAFDKPVFVTDNKRIALTYLGLGGVGSIYTVEVDTTGFLAINNDTEMYNRKIARPDALYSILTAYRPRDSFRTDEITEAAAQKGYNGVVFGKVYDNGFCDTYLPKTTEKFFGEEVERAIYPDDPSVVMSVINPDNIKIIAEERF